MATTIRNNDPAITSERVFKDLDLNFTPHPIKKDVSKHVNERAIINSVKNLVSTNFYERPFRPELGSNIRSLLFEMVDSVIDDSSRIPFLTSREILFTAETISCCPP